MKTKKLVLLTSEGSKYIAWLETEDRDFVRNVDIRTVNILYRADFIKPINSEKDKLYNKREFPYVLK